MDPTQIPMMLRRCLHSAKDALAALASSVSNLSPPVDNETLFRCNVCGRHAKTPTSRLGREEVTCRCGSSVRLRSLVHYLTLELFGESLAIPDIPARPDIVGIDMSGAPAYSTRLTKRLGYTNTFLHKPPILDITAPEDEWLSACDFIISSDVLEHVAPPVSIAFDNIIRLLKPGGVLVLTVPWVTEDPTIEHFPGLADYHIEKRGSERILVNRLPDGQSQEFGDLVFHGGEGETLEMRVFSKSGLLDELVRAGFCDVRIHSEPYPEFGIIWQQPWSLPITARRPPSPACEP